ncbi:MAG: oligosaccharide flippase family protein [Magnetococcales bacterium]|nr:oligosaccharide flippase family protein [Magnetococcales bacterium]
MRGSLPQLLARGVEKGAMFVFFAGFARIFGAEAFGDFSYLFTVCTLLFILFDLGGNFYQVPLLAKATDGKDPLATLIMAKSGLFLIILLATLWFAPSPLLLILLISFYLNALVVTARSWLYCRRQFQQEASLNVLEKLLFLTAATVGGGIGKSLMACYWSFSVGRVGYLWAFFRRNRPRLNFPSRSEFLETIQNSWSYLLHAAVVVVFIQIDIVMLKHMGVASQDIGFYSASYRIIAVGMVLPTVLLDISYPQVTEYMGNQWFSKVHGVLFHPRRLNLLAGAILTIGVGFCASDLIWLIYGADFSASAPLLVLMSPLFLISFLRFADSAIISGTDFNRQKLIVSGLAAGTNITLNLFLIPAMGVYGALVATVITEILVLMGFHWVATRACPGQPHKTRDLLTILLGSSLVFGTGLLFYDHPIIRIAGWVILISGGFYLLLELRQGSMETKPIS